MRDEITGGMVLAVSSQLFLRVLGQLCTLHRLVLKGFSAVSNHHRKLIATFASILPSDCSVSLLLYSVGYRVGQ